MILWRTLKQTDAQGEAFFFILFFEEFIKKHRRPMIYLNLNSSQFC